MADEQKWKIGDVVQLKSGGPLMTVSKPTEMADGQPAVHVTWFDGNKRLNDTFVSALLEASDGGFVAPIVG